MTNDCKQLLVSVLLKKAKGYSYKEKTDEYNVVEGKKVLIKSRVVTKRALPDLSAIKVLLELDDGTVNFADMTDEQLRAEKLRLISLLNDSMSDDSMSERTENDE